jgi:hypothetical protein
VRRPERRRAQVEQLPCQLLEHHPQLKRQAQHEQLQQSNVIAKCAVGPPRTLAVRSTSSWVNVSNTNTSFVVDEANVAADVSRTCANFVTKLRLWIVDRSAAAH